MATPNLEERVVVPLPGPTRYAQLCLLFCMRCNQSLPMPTNEVKHIKHSCVWVASARARYQRTNPDGKRPQ